VSVGRDGRNRLDFEWVGCPAPLVAASPIMSRSQHSNFEVCNGRTDSFDTSTTALEYASLRSTSLVAADSMIVAL
jgi:hypothetical protein